MTALDPLTIYDVLKYLVDNKGAGWIDLGLADKLAAYVPESFDDFCDKAKGASTQ